ncbi:GNAT family N-acetyltransferase [Ilumatobacter nonamiensis]|uniref:GNAT family N-acetyltransferase n=1 Tax=Ilumatobacter nonamiensis TaxID=467093 RepID=UPI00034AA280|nr:GNAT family N-acetyltransferase [Ilumatobacter nonamiensis]
MRQAIAFPSARARIRAWPLDASIGHLVMLDVAMIPTVDQVDRWLAEAYDARPDENSAPRRAVRTGALSPRAAEPFLRVGFEVVDRLALLERTLTTTEPSPPRTNDETATIKIRRVRRREMPSLAEIDQAAFAAGWRNDARSLGEIANATPSSTRRLALDSRDGTRRPVGFQISGHAGPTGYIQRLAVHPDAWGMGVGGRLVHDALSWLTRRGVDRALVNTGVDNARALRLYDAAGFEVLDEELVVLEHRRPA